MAKLAKISVTVHKYKQTEELVLNIQAFLQITYHRLKQHHVIKYMSDHVDEVIGHKLR